MNVGLGMAGGVLFIQDYLWRQCIYWVIIYPLFTTAYVMERPGHNRRHGRFDGRLPLRMVTPPKHLAIAAALPPHRDTLYRAAIPAPANLPFLPRLPLATLLLLRPAPLPADHHLRAWARQHGVRVEWVRADEMDEEKLGMGRTEVALALKVRPAARASLTARPSWTRRCTRCASPTSTACRIQRSWSRASGSCRAGIWTLSSTRSAGACCQ